MLPAAAVILALGVWFAHRASVSIVGEALFQRTVYWIGVREQIINRKFNAALSLDTKDKQNHTALIETVEKDVIPFWREAGDRLAKIELPKNSPSASTLEVLQDITDGRADAFQLLEDGLRNNDSKAIAKANADLKHVEQTANERRATRQ